VIPEKRGLAVEYPSPAAHFSTFSGQLSEDSIETLDFAELRV
jgi:hypothetical protein